MGPYLLAYHLRGLALAAPLVIAVGGFAQASCYSSRQQLPATTVAQFRADPGQLQSKYPNGGARMISMVRDLVASDPAMLPHVLDLSANSNADQINAIGAGLGQAALVCARGDPTFANEIHQMVAVVNNQPLAVTFAAVVGNVPIAAPSVRSGGDAGAPSSKNVGVTSPAAPANPLSLGATAPTGASVGATATTGATNVPTNTGTTATQAATSTLGIPTEATAPGGTASTGATNALGVGPTQATTTVATGSTGVTGTPSGAATNSSAPSGVTGTIATSPTGAAAPALTGVTGALGTGAIGSPALSGVTGALGTVAPVSAIQSGAPGSSGVGLTAAGATGSTGLTGALGASSTGGPITTTGVIGSVAPSAATGAVGMGLTGSTASFVGGPGTPSQTTLAPTSFFTLNFNARGEPVTSRTTNTSATPRSVSPSQ
jgi:hypothetical protein